MSIVLIDQQIVFDEDNFLLYRADADKAEALRLGAIASRCFALLLRAKGAVVRKRELLDGAWGQFGLEVTENSLAQVVRQLRVALEQLAPGREFLVTLPRIGYKLAERVDVTVLERADYERASEGGSVGESPLEALPTTAAQATDEPFTVDSAPPTPIPPASGGASSSRRRTALLATVWVICCVLAFVIAAAPFDRPALRRLSFAPSVVLQGNQYHVRVSENSGFTREMRERLTSHVAHVNLMTGREASAYHVYVLKLYPNISGVLCDGPVEQEPGRCTVFRVYGDAP